MRYVLIAALVIAVVVAVVALVIDVLQLLFGAAAVLALAAIAYWIIKAHLGNSDNADA